MILITGATGNIAKLLVEKLATHGVAFKALVRSAEKGAALGCDYVIGDYDDPASIEVALSGIDRVFLNGDPGPAMVGQMRSLIDTAKAAGVSYVVRISVPGADSGLSVGKQHGAVDAYLSASGIPATTLRPMVFMQNMMFNADSIRRDGRFYGAYGQGRIPFVDCADIAACAAALLTGADRPGEAFALSGAEALTYAQVAEKLSVVLGKAVHYVDLPVEQIIASMTRNGMPADFAEQLGVMMTMMSRSDGSGLTSSVRDLTGHAPRTMSQYLADNIAAFG